MPCPLRGERCGLAARQLAESHARQLRLMRLMLWFFRRSVTFSATRFFVLTQGLSARAWCWGGPRVACNNFVCRGWRWRTLWGPRVACQYDVSALTRPCCWSDWIEQS